ncbi:MAG: hypothetical protein AAGP08_03170 [Pseudomonadota bacterium]
MSAARILRVYLDDVPRARAEAGNFNIMNKIRAAFESKGYRVDFVKNSEAERAKSVARRGYALFHMDHPFHARALTMRKAYFYPFWRIETSSQRWDWEIAKTPFDPSAVNRKAADAFFTSWRKRLFPGLGDVSRDGFVYIPLQGRLLEQRSFQSQSPLDMIRTTLAYDAERQVIVGLHPGETYLPEERDALKQLVDGAPRVQLSSQPMEGLLQRCDYVVTQNSSVALNGFFLEKPAVLFARIDFAHITANVHDLGPEAAIKNAPMLTPDYPGYLHWFLKETAINGGSKLVEDQILAAVRHHGWEV